MRRHPAVGLVNMLIQDAHTDAGTAARLMSLATALDASAVVVDVGDLDVSHWGAFPVETLPPSADQDLPPKVRSSCGVEGDQSA